MAMVHASVRRRRTPQNATRKIVYREHLRTEVVRDSSSPTGYLKIETHTRSRNVYDLR